MDLIEALQAPYIQRALIVLLLLAVMGAVVGVHVYLRRAAFLTEVFQHTVFPGIAAAYLLEGSLLLGAGVAAGLTVVLLASLTLKGLASDDSVFAVLVTLFFAVGVVIVSKGSDFQHDLSVLLFGRILTVTDQQVVETAVLAAVVIVALFVFRKELVLRAFDSAGAAALGYRQVLLDLLLNICVAIFVVAAVRAVGSVLLVAFVVTPVVAARMVTASISRLMAYAAVVTSVAAVAGVAISYGASIDHGVEVPPGAAAVVCITLLCVVLGMIGKARSQWAS